MPRPTVLIAEPEPNDALSTRKLVMETAKFNVLTAHSPKEAIDTFKMFPNISAAVLVAGGNCDFEDVGKTIKKSGREIPVIAVSAQIGHKNAAADYHVNSHDPEELLELARRLLGDPREEGSEREMPGRVGLNRLG